MIICKKELNASDLSPILFKINKKKEDYELYSFNSRHQRTLLTFFDLAQEYQTLENFYKISVFVPKLFLGFDCCLYIIDPDDGMLKTICDSMNSLSVCGNLPPEGVKLSETPYELGDSFLTPIRGNFRLLTVNPITHAEDIIGMFEVFPRLHFENNDTLFFEKYANRIGYNLHYKMISIQNEDHLKFINNLVADIEHNIITPNIRNKLLLRQLKKKINTLQELALSCPADIENENIDIARNKMLVIYNELLQHYDEMEKHYENNSLFLESLLRREHFEKGELVLRRRMCAFKREVIDPQIERFKERFNRLGIRIDNLMGGVPDEDIPLLVDIGLLAQVYANYFSNVEKYCQEVTNEHGHKVKFMAYGRQVLLNFLGKGQDGIKFNVFSTGKHLSPDDQKHIYEEGYRGDNTLNRPGSGHGLHFVRKVIEVHGGVAGYEPKYLGNNFYFILPLQKDLIKEKETLEGLEKLQDTQPADICPVKKN